MVTVNFYTFLVKNSLRENFIFLLKTKQQEAQLSYIIGC